MYYRTRGFRIFNAINLVFLGMTGVFCLLPMVHLLAVSFSGSAWANAGLVTFWPRGFNVEAYVKTFESQLFLGALSISVLRASVGTALTMIVTLMAAYALSKDGKALVGRNVYIWYMVFTMLFSGGLIPGYILIVKLRLIDSFWSLVLPNLVSAFNVILLLNFFRTLPRELEEASLIDGSGHLGTFFRIYLPLSLPAIATVSLFNMVFHWNSYFDGLVYISTKAKLPLASVLQTIIVQQDFRIVGPEVMAKLSQRTLKAAQIFIGALPILAVYPFLQRYFISGIVLGAVKE